MYYFSFYLIIIYLFIYLQYNCPALFTMFSSADHFLAFKEMLTH